jgi:hypothetical protein
MRFALTAALGLAIVGGSVSSASSARSAASACVGARVHYGPAPNPTLRDLRLPWVSAGGRGRELVGYLWYYGGDLQGRDRLVAYVGGRLPDRRTSEKIMWVPRRVQMSVLIVSGHQLDGAGTFHDAFRVATSGSLVLFPSTLDIPSTGCWKLTVRNGRFAARFAVVVLPASP